MSNKHYTTAPDKEEKQQRARERRALARPQKHGPLVSRTVTASERETIILIGGGGHCRSCIDVIEEEGRFAIREILDANESLTHPILTHDLLGTGGGHSKTKQDLSPLFHHRRGADQGVGSACETVRIFKKAPCHNSYDHFPPRACLQVRGSERGVDCYASCHREQRGTCGQ